MKFNIWQIGIGLWVFIAILNLLDNNIIAAWNAGCAGFYCSVINTK